MMESISETLLSTRSSDWHLPGTTARPSTSRQGASFRSPTARPI
jgi:hypothetical protein